MDHLDERGKKAKVKIRKSTLQKYWSFLKEQVDLKHIADELIEFNVLTPDQWMSLKKHSTNERMDEFLYILFQDNVKNYHNFVAALRKKGYDYVADVLEEKTKLDPKPRHAQLHASRITLSTESERTEASMLLEKGKNEGTSQEDKDKKFMQTLNENMQQLMHEQARIAREQMKAELQAHKKEMMEAHKENYERFMGVLNNKQHIEKELGTLKIELKNLEGERFKLEEERKRVMSKLAESEKAAKENLAKLKAVSNELEDLKKKHDESKNSVKAADSTIKKLEKEKMEIKMKLENKEVENDNFRATLSKKQKLMKDLETEKNSLMKQLDNAEQKRTDLAKDIKKFEIMLGNLDPTIRSKSLRQNSGTDSKKPQIGRKK